MKNNLILSIFIATIIALPNMAFAGFNPVRIIDPFCLFSCDDNYHSHRNNYYDYNYYDYYDYNYNTYNYGDPYESYYTPQYYYISPLGASCYSSFTSGNVGQLVNWRASVYGGNGDYYVKWTGTDGLLGTGMDISKVYNSSGSKSASITVISGNQSFTKNCNTVDIYSNTNGYPSTPLPPPPPVPQNPPVNLYNPPTPIYNYNQNYNYNSPLGASCYSSFTSGNVGQLVNWRASVYGGNGSYAVTWSGTDGLSGSGMDISKIYNYPGSKTANITVVSDGQTINKNCNYVDIYDSHGNYYH